MVNSGSVGRVESSGADEEEQVIGFIQGTLNRIATARLKAHRTNRNCLVPFRRLPLEIVHHIMLLSLDKEIRYYSDLTERRRVRTYFRDAVDVCPPFFSVIRYGMPSSAISDALARSDPIPLAVSFVSYENGLSDTVLDYLALICEHRARWGSLNVEVKGLGEIHEYALLDATPVLRNLSIEAGYCNEEPIPLFGGAKGAPNLQNVKLVAAAIRWDTGILSGLRTMGLYNISNAGPTVHQITTVLWACPQLKELTLWSVDFQEVGTTATEHIPAAELPLLELEILCLEGILPIVTAYLLCSIKISSQGLRRLSVTTQEADPDSPSTFPDSCADNVGRMAASVVCSTKPQRLEISVSYGSIVVAIEGQMLRLTLTQLDDGYGLLRSILRSAGLPHMDSPPLVSLTLAEYMEAEDGLHDWGAVGGEAEGEAMQIWITYVEQYIPKVTALTLKGAFAFIEQEGSTVKPLPVSGILELLSCPVEGKVDDVPRMIFPDLHTLIIGGCYCGDHGGRALQQLVEIRGSGAMESGERVGVAPLMRLYLSGREVSRPILNSIKILMAERQGKVDHRTSWEAFEDDVQGYMVADIDADKAAIATEDDDDDSADHDMDISGSDGVGADEEEDSEESDTDLNEHDGGHAETSGPTTTFPWDEDDGDEMDECERLCETKSYAGSDWSD